MPRSMKRIREESGIRTRPALTLFGESALTQLAALYLPMGPPLGLLCGPLSRYYSSPGSKMTPSLFNSSLGPSHFAQSSERAVGYVIWLDFITFLWNKLLRLPLKSQPTIYST